jgi:hypothetical protein
MTDKSTELSYMLLINVHLSKHQTHNIEYVLTTCIEQLSVFNRRIVNCLPPCHPKLFWVQKQGEVIISLKWVFKVEKSNSHSHEIKHDRVTRFSFFKTLES